MTSFNEMKGLKELTAVVNNFTQQFDCVAEISDTFWVDIATNTVYFSLFYEKREEDEKSILYFTDHCCCNVDWLSDLGE